MREGDERVEGRAREMVREGDERVEGRARERVRVKERDISTYTIIDHTRQGVH